LEAHLKLAKVKSVQELADSICGKYDKVVGKLHRRDASIVEYKAKLKRMEKEKERLQETLDEMGWTPIKALK
jgi:predicted nuclease with TOPRIM domain